MKENSVNTNKEQLRAIARGNEVAFQQLFKLYSPKIYGYLMILTGSPEAAEDNLQDIFLKIWEKRDSLPEIDDIGAYLRQMAFNKAKSGYRRMAVHEKVYSILKREGSRQDEAEVTATLHSKEVQEFLLKIIDQLSPQQRRVFLLSREKHLKQVEIAQQLGISINTVKTHIAGALHVLRKELTTRYGPQAIAIFVIFQLQN